MLTKRELYQNLRIVICPRKYQNAFFVISAYQKDIDNTCVLRSECGKH